MLNKLSGWEDTIVAPATAPGVSAIAVIRLTGKNAFQIIDKLFPSKKISAQPTHTLHVGLLKNENELIDEVVIAVFKGQKSFAGEDTIEISCHGSPYIQEQIIKACVSHGARVARPGEFTQRAFLNGKMDLTQAEAVADIISANTAAAQKAALHAVKGGFTHDLALMREQLTSFSALIELELDFAEEDVEFADRKKIETLVDDLSVVVTALVDSFRLGNVIKNGVSVAIVGEPNAGKSTLLNALLNEERSIVSELAGTTRDTIEEMLNINGILFRLIDTAGIRAHSGDVIEKLGIERSYDNAAKADLVLHVIDATQDTGAEISRWLTHHNKQFIAVLNKSDLADIEPRGVSLDRPEGIRIAAKTGAGIDKLKEEIFRNISDKIPQTESTIITNTRHLESLKKIADALREIRTGLENNITGDLLSADIRAALYHLGEITGEVTTEDKLDYIFSKFCIGK